MSIVSLSAATKVVIDSVSSIAEVHEYETADFESFPAVCITPKSSEGTTLDTGSDLRTYTFILRVYYLRKNNAANVENNLRKAVYDIIDALDSSGRLSGAVDFPVSSAPTNWGYADIAGGTARVAELEIICKKSISITP